VEEEEEGKEEEKNNNSQPASAEVAIENNGQQNQHSCSAVCVLFATKERAQCTRCDVGMCVVPCFLEYHTKVNLQYNPLFVNTVCHDKTVIQGATELLKQPELFE